MMEDLLALEGNLGMMWWMVMLEESEPLFKPG
jgi:hypothetical protein